MLFPENEYWTVTTVCNHEEVFLNQYSGPGAATQMHKIVFVHFEWLFYLDVFRKDRTLAIFKAHITIDLIECVLETVVYLLVSLVLQCSNLAIQANYLLLNLLAGHAVFNILTGNKVTPSLTCCNVVFTSLWLLRLQSKKFLLKALNLRHEIQRYFLESVIEYDWHCISCILGHNLSVRSMSIKHTKYMNIIITSYF